MLGILFDSNLDNSQIYIRIYNLELQKREHTQHWTEYI